MNKYIDNHDLFARPINLYPVASFQTIELAELNVCLEAWGHKMGALNRPNYGNSFYHCLFHNDEPVGIAAASRLITPHVGGGLSHLKRDKTIELSRLCAARPYLCRVVLRLWREFVFPHLGYEVAISYQDADLHNGNTYRFDGWKRSPTKSSSGIDARSGKKGRNKWIWVWPPDAVNKYRYEGLMETEYRGLYEGEFK